MLLLAIERKIPACYFFFDKALLFLLSGNYHHPITMPESWISRGWRRVVLGIYGPKKTVVEEKPSRVTQPNNKPKNEADKRRLDFATRNDNKKRLKRTLDDGTLQGKLRNMLQSSDNIINYWLLYNAGISCSILTGGYNELEWEQHTQGLVSELVGLYSIPGGVELLEKDIHNIENYDAEKNSKINDLMDELLESEANIRSIAIAKMLNNDEADESYTDGDDQSTIPSPKSPLNINMKEEDDMVDFTNENEELGCNDDTSPRTDSCEKKNDGSERSVKSSPVDAMFDVSTFTNENDASPTPFPPTDSVDLDELDERDTATKFAAQTCQIPTSSSCCSSSPKKGKSL